MLLINRHIQDPVHRFDSTKLLREYVMHKLVSFSSLASFVKDFTEKVAFNLVFIFIFPLDLNIYMQNFCIVVAVTRDPFVRERLTTAWHTNIHAAFETSFIPK